MVIPFACIVASPLSPIILFTATGVPISKEGRNLANTAPVYVRDPPNDTSEIIAELTPMSTTTYSQV